MKKIMILFTIISLNTVANNIQTKLSHTKVVRDKEGKLEKVQANLVSPGDILEYTFTIDNQETESIKNLNPAIPVPTGTTLIPNTEKPKEAFVSVNGRDFHPYPIKVNGEEVDLNEYRIVSWNVEKLEPGEKIELQMQVLVNGGDEE